VNLQDAIQLADASPMLRDGPLGRGAEIITRLDPALAMRVRHPGDLPFV
jgi:hypothetical protein